MWDIPAEKEVHCVFIQLFKITGQIIMLIKVDVQVSISNNYYPLQ